MSVSSTGSTNKSGSSLDVAGIVKQLMEVESKPLAKLDTKISVSTVKISTLGQFNSQLSALKSALTDLQTPSNFSAWSANFSTPGVATAQLAPAAVAGSYQMEVSKLARPSIWNVSGFATEAAARSWYDDAAQSAVKSRAEATVFKAADGQFVLSLKANLTGVAAGSALDTAVNAAALPANHLASRYQASEDAAFKLNGVSFTRSTNTVTDALTGVTLNLSGTTAANNPINLTVAKAESSARPKLEAFAKAYNDLQTFYKAQTVASVDVATRGVLNSDFAVGSMMRQLLNGLMLPLKNAQGANLPASNNGTDLTALGLKLQDDGLLAVDDNLLSKATDLQSRLANGLRIGFEAASGKDLATRITDMLASGGMLQERIKNEQMVQKDLNTRKLALQDKLESVQARYTAQYAALDALLFQLNSTSDSLKSALDGLTSSQKNN
jgi:flagellar hook-associated protein 2